MLKVYYKKDINMPKGKIVSQASHALCSFILGTYDLSAKIPRNPDKLEDIKKLLEACQVIPISSLEFEDLQCLIEIEDQGRTVFKGKHTVTSGLVVEASVLEQIIYQPNPHSISVSETAPVRLVHVVSKEYARLVSETIVQECVKAQALYLLQKMQNPQFLSNSAFQTWATGSFAKIVLATAQSNILNLISSHKLNKYYTYVECNSKLPVHVIIGPVHKEDMEGVTSSFNMMS